MSAVKRRINKLRTEVVLADLARMFPKTFHVSERKRIPLALHIHVDLIKRLAPIIAAGAITEIDVKNALGSYCNNKSYMLRCCRPGAARINLDGNKCGSVTAKEAAFAVARLKTFGIEPKTEVARGGRPRATNSNRRHQQGRHQQGKRHGDQHRRTGHGQPYRVDDGHARP